MNNDPQKSVEELIVDYYRKDKWMTKAILVLATVGVATVIITAFNVWQLQRQINARTQDIQSQINCVGEYFSQSDRQNLQIPNLQSCTIIRVR